MERMGTPNVIQAIQTTLRQVERERDQHLAVVRGIMGIVCRRAELDQRVPVSGGEIVGRVREIAMQYVTNGRRLAALDQAAQAIVAHLGPCEVDASGVCHAHFKDPADQCPVRHMIEATKPPPAARN